MLAVVALTAAAPGARAGTLSISGTTLTYTAAPGETNEVFVSHPNGATTTIRIDEDGTTSTGAAATITLGTGAGACEQETTSEFDCPRGSITLVDVNLSDGNDSAFGGNDISVGGNEGDPDFDIPLNLDGSSGNDTLRGEDADDTLTGSTGDDTLLGEAGNDTISCSTGSDTVSYNDDRTSSVTINTTTNSFPDADAIAADTSCEQWTGTRFNDTFTGDVFAQRFEGLGGIDTFSYNDGRDTAVVASLTSGTGPDGDTYANVENLTGGNGNDTITGDDLANVLNGDVGDDTLIGAGAADTLTGGTGSDAASYQERSTAVTAAISEGGTSAGNTDSDAYNTIENLTGGSGADTLTGNSAVNRLSGGLGNDTLIGGAGADNLDGGGGQNTVSYADGRVTGLTVDLTTGANPDGDTLVAGTFVHATGGGGDDILIGTTGANTLDGGGGFDAASYQDGRGTPVNINRTANTNTDGDTYAGIERFIGSDAGDTLTGSASADTFNGDDGADTINGNDGADTLRGDDGTDTINGGLGNDAALEGGEGDDTINGDDGTDTLRGDDGGDTLDGGAGNDPTLQGGLGNDTVRGGTGDDTIDGGPGSDPLLDGGDGNDTIDGSTEDDTLVGGAGNDVVRGGAGNDSVTPGAGADTVVDGGTETDTINYNDGRTAGVIVDLSTAGADGTAAIDGGEVAQNFENVIGTTLADQITGSAGANNLNGGDADDSLFGLAGADTITGSDGNDTIGGGDGNDVSLSGGNGNDSVDGGPGNDAAVSGGGGSDVLAGGDGNDGLLGGDGDDQLDGGLQADSMDGGTGFDTVAYPRTEAVSVSFNGTADDGATGEGDNAIATEKAIGGSGADTLTGSAAGDEVLIGGPGGDVIDGGAGTGDATSYEDHVTAVTVTLNSGTADDGSTGEGDDVRNIEELTGSPGNDTLTGDAGANALDGGAGDDTLRGGLGPDLLTGGPGTDTVTYSERASGSPVTVSLDAGAGGTPSNDGASGEQDAVAADVENIRGGEGADTLTGNSGVNAIFGGGGNDTLEGLAGADAFDGGAGDDNVKAQDGVADSGTCGDGSADRADVDSIDTLTSCEITNLVKPFVDNDGDGIEASVDCDDGNAAIRPGAVEIVGNAVDENCDRIIAPFPQLLTVIDNAFQAFPGFTVFKVLTLKNLPSGAVAKVTCKRPKGKSRAAKRSCAFKTKTVRFPNGKAQHKLLGLLKKRRLAVKTVLTIEITAPQSFGKFLVFTIRRSAVRKTSGCLSPTTGKRTACPT